MPLRLRSARADDSEDIPVHYESIALRPMVRAPGWAFGIAAVAGGVAMMILHQGSWLEVLGAIAGAAGAIAIVALIRCSCFEITLGRRWLAVGAGPLRRRVAPDSVDGPVLEREARGWRRLFAVQEQEVRLTVHGSSLVVPTLQPGELGAALSALRQDPGETEVGDPA